MNGKLTMLQGPGNALFMDPRGVGDVEAGLLFFSALTRLYPGVTWRDLVLSNRRMMGCNAGYLAGKCSWLAPWNCVVNAVTDTVTWTGDRVADVVDYVADKGGDLVRLATDEQVVGAVGSAAAAYTTGGVSAALAALTPEQQAAMKAAGITYKDSWAGGGSALLKNPVTWILGGVTVLSLGALVMKK